MFRILPLLMITCLFFVPGLADAAGFVTCDGTDCSTCSLVEMVNTMIIYLFGIIGIIFAILMMIAGFGLVTSGGNTSAVTAAKSKFTNAIIGLIIVMAAWLVVDTIMRGLLTGDEGEIAGWGPWSEVKCTTQTVPMKLTDLAKEKETPVPGPVGPVGPAPAMVSLRGLGVNVASWPGIDGPGRTDKAIPSAANAAKWMQEEGLKRFGRIPFQVTAAYTDGVGHSPNSQHYKGTAIDFQPINGITKNQVATLAKDAGFKYVLIETRHVHADMR